jgi:glycosyltransferase involved in cell wall biosynthesis
MKIAYFIAEYQSFTGSQKSLFYTVRAWQQQGGEVVVFLPGEGTCAQVFRQHGISTVIFHAPPSLHLFQRRLLRLPSWKRAVIWIKEVLPYSWQISRLLTQAGCQLLHCNSTRSILIAGWIPRWRRVPLVLHIRGKQVEKGILWRLAQHLANRIVIVADHLRAEINPAYRSKVRLLYNAIVPEEVERLSIMLEGELTFPQDERSLVVSLASMVPGKGIHHLIHTAAIVNRKQPALFAVAGREADQAYSIYVRELAGKLCRDSFFFMGWLTNPYPLLRRAQVAALATISIPEAVPTDNPTMIPTGEGVPRFLLEAMALGKPIVATAVDGCDEAVTDGETGFLVPPANPAAMAEAIETLLKNPELAKQMGERGRQRVEKHFSMERHRRALAEIYGELLRGG